MVGFNFFKHSQDTMRQHTARAILFLLLFFGSSSYCWPTFKVEADVGLENASRTLAEALDKSLGDHVPHTIRSAFLQFKELLDGLRDDKEFTKDFVNSLKNTGV